MLKSLTIRNYALIESVEIEFESGLNILTGETGAGKSIIIDAMSLILGDRTTSGSGSLFRLPRGCGSSAQAHRSRFSPYLRLEITSKRADAEHCRCRSVWRCPESVAAHWPRLSPCAAG